MLTCCHLPIIMHKRLSLLFQRIGKSCENLEKKCLIKYSETSHSLNMNWNILYTIHFYRIYKKKLMFECKLCFAEKICVKKVNMFEKLLCEKKNYVRIKISFQIIIKPNFCLLRPNGHGYFKQWRECSYRFSRGCLL